MTEINAIPADVASVFDQFSPEQREILLEARAEIFKVAMEDPRIGKLDEVLRWGQPAYITKNKKTGSTIRLGIEKTTGKPALFFNCNTSLVEDLREQFGSILTYSKNRAVLLDTDEAAGNAWRSGIASALTYHLRR